MVNVGYQLGYSWDNACGGLIPEDMFSVKHKKPAPCGARSRPGRNEMSEDGQSISVAKSASLERSPRVSVIVAACAQPWKRSTT